MKQVLGVTFEEKAGQQTVGVYIDENGAECFVTDEPYLLSDGVTLTEPLPIMIVDGPYDTNAPTLQAPIPLALELPPLALQPE